MHPKLFSDKFLISIQMLFVLFTRGCCCLSTEETSGVNVRGREASPSDLSIKNSEEEGKEELRRNRRSGRKNK